jgi:hypothetical protein
MLCLYYVHFYLFQASCMLVFVVVRDVIKLIIFSGENKLWISHLCDTVVLWTSVPVTILNNFNCVLEHTHNCWTTGIVMPSFVLGLQHFHRPLAHCMHIFLVILDLITLMAFRKDDKLLRDFLHPAVTSTPTHLPEHAFLKGLSF